PSKAEEKCETPEGSVQAEDPLWKVLCFSKLAEAAPLGKGVFFRSAGLQLSKYCRERFTTLFS
ncbi:hypothetical protein, partial [Gracilibacillus boraciitolerans]|uniref:hypothetical protein n=1 Tax=Gracilibacillus boraciitolerans TaxID=307521 RepID=UPI0005521508